MNRRWILFAIIVGLAVLATGCGDVSSKTECQAHVPNACGGTTLFCDHSGRCQPCSPGLLNCDGINHCEKQGSCYLVFDGGGVD